jgi:threonine 3-dehydrogenase
MNSSVASSIAQLRLHRSRLGDRVTVVPATTCGTCAACVAADHDACRSRRGIGVLRDGGFARFVAVPSRNCIKLPANLPDHVAALTEPMAIGANAVATGEIKGGERVLVFGPGTIGQTIALMARRAGAAVTIVGRADPHRLSVLRDLGFTDLLDTALPADAERLAGLGDGFDCVFEASGAAAAFRAAPAHLRPGGRLVVVGIHGTPGEIDLVRLVRKRLRILGSFSSPAAIWPSVVEVLAGDPELYARLVTHRLPLKDIAAGFEAGHRREASKVVVHPE